MGQFLFLKNKSYKTFIVTLVVADFYYRLYLFRQKCEYSIYCPSVSSDSISIGPSRSSKQVSGFFFLLLWSEQLLHPTHFIRVFPVIQFTTYIHRPAAAGSFYWHTKVMGRPQFRPALFIYTFSGWVVHTFRSFSYILPRNTVIALAVNTEAEETTTIGYSLRNVGIFFSCAHTKRFNMYYVLMIPIQ
jgi:hypothetical protein